MLRDGPSVVERPFLFVSKFIYNTLDGTLATRDVSFFFDVSKSKELVTN